MGTLAYFVDVLCHGNNFEFGTDFF